MKVFFAFLLCVLLPINVWSQDVFGKWKTIDDVTGKAKGIIEIYEDNGKVFGRIIDIIDTRVPKDSRCFKCTGKRKNKPFIGMVFIENLKKHENEYSGGRVLDPNNGKEYRCYISLEETDKLKIRGYVGFSLFGRTQYWYRVDD